MAAQLVADALMMAIWLRGKPDALLHHSDQGSQYTSEQFQKLLADHGVTCSMSRSGNVWDNAAMESFFSSLKTERTARKVYRTRNQARADVFDYIERFYNLRRRHSTIGYLSPMDFEKNAASAQGACPPDRQQLKGKLWEMRLNGWDGIARAVYVTATGRRVVVVHAFVKKAQKTPRAALELAEQRAKEIQP